MVKIMSDLGRREFLLGAGLRFHRKHHVRQSLALCNRTRFAQGMSTSFSAAREASREDRFAMQVAESLERAGLLAVSLRLAR